MNIHMVEPLNNFVKLPDNNWESGWWTIAEAKARELVGGEIYFHKKQGEPSFFGGTITGYRLEPDVQFQGKVAFTLNYNPACRNVATNKNGWSKRMKIIGND